MTPAERRRALIDDLRNLPPEWEWDFDRIGTDTCGCALGRAEMLFGWRYTSISATLLRLGLTNEHRPIFGVADRGFEQVYGVRSRADVTPQMVADALERIRE